MKRFILSILALGLIIVVLAVVGDSMRPTSQKLATASKATTKPVTTVATVTKPTVQTTPPVTKPAPTVDCQGFANIVNNNIGSLYTSGTNGIATYINNTKAYDQQLNSKYTGDPTLTTDETNQIIAGANNLIQQTNGQVNNMYETYLQTIATNHCPVTISIPKLLPFYTALP